MKDSPAALAAVPHLRSGAARRDPGRRDGRHRRSTRCGSRRGDVRVDDGRDRGGRRAGGEPRRLLGLPRRARATSARTRISTRRSPAGCRTTLEPPENFVADPAAHLVAARPRARRGRDPRLGARRRDGGAALGHDDARRPPRLAERDRRLARRDRGGARRARRPLGALLRDVRPRRAGARAAGVAENRRFLERVAREQPPLARGDGRRARLVHALRRDARRVRRAPRRSASALHVHAAEDARRRARRAARYGVRVVERLHAPARSTSARCSRTASTSTTTSSTLVARRERDRRPQRPLEHEQLDRPRARRPRSGRSVALGTDGIGADMFEESRAAFFRLREDDLGAGADWPLARLAEGARARRPRLRRAAARDARARRAGRPRRARLRRAGAARRRQLRRSLGLRPLVAARPRRDGRGRVGRRRPAARARRPGTSSPPTRSREAERLWRRLDEIAAARVRAERRLTMVMRGPRRALPAGQAPDPRRHATTRSSPRSTASRPSGRRRAGSCARRRCRWPRSPPSPSGSRSARASSTTGRATSACSRRRSRRSTTSRPGGSSSASAPGGSRSPRRSASTARKPLAGDARDGRGVPAAARDGARHLPRRVRPPRRRRDRHRPRRPLAEARADLHRRDRR